MADMSLRIERYRLSATQEAVWDVTWGDQWAIHRWLVVALWRARKRFLRSTSTRSNQK